jgi:hypothetical protein
MEGRCQKRVGCGNFTVKVVKVSLKFNFLQLQSRIRTEFASNREIPPADAKHYHISANLQRN